MYFPPQVTEVSGEECSFRLVTHMKQDKATQPGSWGVSYSDGQRIKPLGEN